MADEPSSFFKASALTWSCLLVAGFLICAGVAVQIMGTKSNKAFGTVGISIGAVPATPPSSAPTTKKGPP